VALVDADQTEAVDQDALAALVDDDLLLVAREEVVAAHAVAGGVRALDAAAGQADDRDVVGAGRRARGRGRTPSGSANWSGKQGNSRWSSVVPSGGDRVSDLHAAEPEVAALAHGGERGLRVVLGAADVPAEHEARVLGAGRGQHEQRSEGPGDVRDIRACLTGAGGLGKGHRGRRRRGRGRSRARGSSSAAGARSRRVRPPVLAGVDVVEAEDHEEDGEVGDEAGLDGAAAGPGDEGARGAGGRTRTSPSAGAATRWTSKS
jgi:hypothetical protein